MRKRPVLLIAACMWAALAGPATPAAAQETGEVAGEGGDEAPPAPASPPRALASNGAIIAMPDISSLDCRGMAGVLGVIDQSGYRGPEPVPPGHPDREIFEYEHRLAAAYYHACIISGSRLDNPGPAFSHGFEQP